MDLNKLPLMKSGLSVTELGSELIVFDSTTSNAHCLDKVGGAVFLACKNSDSVESLRNQLGAEGTDEAIHAALHQLEELGLVEKQVGVDRRAFLSAVGAAAAGVVVASVAAPTPAAAQSCTRCRLDANGIPCDCATCGQPCSLLNPPPSCTDSASGPCAATARCCFEYVKFGTDPGGGGPVTPDANCQREGAGNYRCRNSEPYNYDCNIARTSVGVYTSYFCCCCSSTPLLYPQFSCGSCAPT